MTSLAMFDPFPSTDGVNPVLPVTFDRLFEGFSPEAFAILERLKMNPHVEQYRKELDGIRRYLQAPFRRYRDDLVVNWVLSNRLDLETERNVFSRLLKNDFGAGGCNHHLWLAFYRRHRGRLTDFQLVHSISPDGFDTGLYVGPNDPTLLKEAQSRMIQQSSLFVKVLNPLLETGEWVLEYERVRRGKIERDTITEPVDRLPMDLGQAKGIWLGRSVSRGVALELKGDLVRYGAESLTGLWPVYRLLVSEER